MFVAWDTHILNFPHLLLKVNFSDVLWSSSSSVTMWHPLECLLGNAVIASLHLLRVCPVQIHSLCSVFNWRRGLVVRTPLLCWRTFPAWSMWVKCPLWVNQPGQLSLPYVWGQWMSSKPGCLLASQSPCVCGLSLRPIGCTSALPVTQKRRCRCSYGLWCYISVICLCL